MNEFECGGVESDCLAWWVAEKEGWAGTRFPLWMPGQMRRAGHHLSRCEAANRVKEKVVNGQLLRQNDSEVRAGQGAPPGPCNTQKLPGLWVQNFDERGREDIHT